MNDYINYNAIQPHPTTINPIANQTQKHLCETAHLHMYSFINTSTVTSQIPSMFTECQHADNCSYTLSQIAAAMASTAAFFMCQDDESLCGSKYDSKSIKSKHTIINAYIHRMDHNTSRRICRMIKEAFWKLKEILEERSH